MTPAAVVSRGTLPDQEVVTGPLAELAGLAAGLAGPALVVVGDVVALTASLRSTRRPQRVELATWPALPPPVEPLRADVHLLGDLLGAGARRAGGRAVARRRGADPRARARRARGGDHGECSTRRSRDLDVEVQATVLRAFSLFFQLANIAEQHHRVRRRRDYEREGPVATRVDRRGRRAPDRRRSRATTS